MGQRRSMGSAELWVQHFFPTSNPNYPLQFKAIPPHPIYIQFQPQTEAAQPELEASAALLLQLLPAALV